MLIMFMLTDFELFFKNLWRVISDSGYSRIWWKIYKVSPKKKKKRYITWFCMQFRRLMDNLKFMESWIRGYEHLKAGLLKLYHFHFEFITIPFQNIFLYLKLSFKIPGDHQAFHTIFTHWGKMLELCQGDYLFWEWIFPKVSFRLKYEIWRYEIPHFPVFPHSVFLYHFLRNLLLLMALVHSVFL